MYKSQAFGLGVCLGLTLGLVLVPLIDNVWCAWTETATDDESGVTDIVPIESNSNLPAVPPKSLKVKGSADPTHPTLWRRPRYMSTELGLRKKLIVGMLVDVNVDVDTSNGDQIWSEFLPLINSSLSRHVNKLVFFVNKQSQSLPFKTAVKLSNLIIVNVGINQDSHGSLRVCAVQYFARTFLNDFDFFFLVRHDHYVNGGRLAELVNEISVSESVFWNQSPAFALMSRVRLLSVIERCKKPTFATEGQADNDYDRCIGAALEDQSPGSGLKTSTLHNESEWASSLVIGPLDNATNFRRVHEQVCKKRKEGIHAQISSLQSKIERIHVRTHSTSTLSWPIGFPAAVKPRIRYDVIQWVYFTSVAIFHTSEHFTNKSLRPGQSGVDADTLDVEDIVRSSTELIKSVAGGSPKFLYGYRRFDPGRGMEYVLDFQNKDSTSFVRVEGLRPLLGASPIELVPVPFVAETGRITLLIPVTKLNNAAQLKSMRQFLTDWTAKTHDSLVMSDTKMNTGLLFVLTASTSHLTRPQIETVKNLINGFNNQITAKASKIGYIVISVTNATTKSYVLATVLDVLIKKLILKPESLVAVLEDWSVDIQDDFLNRIRMNTIRGVQIYSPIPFVEYVPEMADVYKLSQSQSPRHQEERNQRADLEIYKTKGYFQHDEYGFLSFYVGDYLHARESAGQAHNSSTPNLQEIFLRSETKIHVFRAPEPDLKIHPVYGGLDETACEEDFRQCSKRWWATKEQLAKLIFSSGL